MKWLPFGSLGPECSKRSPDSPLRVNRDRGGAADGTPDHMLMADLFAPRLPS